MAKLKESDAKKLFKDNKDAKDEGLTKALKEYEKSGSNDPVWLCKLLEDVISALEATKKKNGKGGPVIEFCDDLLKQAKKELQTAEADKKKVEKTVEKSQEGSEFDDNWTEEQAQLMLKAVRAVKKKPLPDDEQVRLEHGHGGRPFLLCIGGNRKSKAALLIAPKPSIKKLVGKYKKECMRATAKPGGAPGKKLIAGMVYGGPKYVFCVDGKPPGGMTKLIKKATLWQLAGLIKIAGVIVSGGGVTLDDENDNEEFNEASIPDVDDKALDQEADEPEVDDKAAYETRWNGLQADLKKALTGTTGEVERMKVLVQSVVATAKNEDYDTADEMLDELETLVKAALAGTAAPPPPTTDSGAPPTPPPPPTPEKKSAVEQATQADSRELAWKDKKKEVEKLMKEALTKDQSLAAVCTKSMEQTGKLAGDKKFDEAIKIYTLLEGQLRKKAGIEPTIIDVQKSRLQWDSTRKTFQGELQRAEKLIIDMVNQANDDAGDDDEVFDTSEISTKLKALYTHVDTQLDEVLIDILDEALNAEGEERKRHYARAAKKVEEYKSFLASDPQMQVVDAAKAFVPDLKVRETVTNALSELSAKLV